jgi:drug/metabolite transporter (DMT)-like permease
MGNIVQLSIIILAGIFVGIADVLIKKIALVGNFWSALKNPLMLIILLLYIVQIIFLIYIFRHHWNLGIVGNLEVVFYSFTMVLLGLLFFGETLSLIQGIGIGLALIGVILINL